MNSEQRVLRTLEYEKTDRIALFDEYLSEIEEIYRKELNIDEHLSLPDFFGVDIAICEPDESPYSSMREVITKNEEYQISRNGWGVLEKTKKQAYFSQELDYLIKDPKDLDKYPFENPLDDRRYAGFKERVAQEKDKGRCVFGKIGGPYIRASFIRGQENFLMDVASDEGFAMDLVNRIGDFLLEVGKREITEGQLQNTGVWISDDMAYNLGPMVSPKSFERIFLPVYKKMVSELKSHGAKYVGLHSDGDIRPLLDMLIDCGIDLINPLEPKAGMSLVDLKKKYGRKLAYVGGMCNSDVLLNGPEERIIKKTEEILEAARDGGVAIGSHSIDKNISVKNYMTYINCIKRNMENW